MKEARAVRLIDADYLLRSLYGGGTRIDRDHANPHFINGIMTSVDAINDAPVIDAVPVVRCKDCEYYQKDGFPDHFGWCYRHHHGFEDSDFCSYGKRR